MEEHSTLNSGSILLCVISLHAFTYMRFVLYLHFQEYRTHACPDIPNVCRWHTAVVTDSRVTQWACRGVQLGFNDMVCFIVMSLFMEPPQLPFYVSNKISPNSVIAFLKKWVDLQTTNKWWETSVLRPKSSWGWCFSVSLSSIVLWGSVPRLTVIPDYRAPLLFLRSPPLQILLGRC